MPWLLAELHLKSAWKTAPTSLLGGLDTTILKNNFISSYLSVQLLFSTVAWLAMPLSTFETHSNLTNIIGLEIGK
jgi:hypothetical protein